MAPPNLISQDVEKELIRASVELCEASYCSLPNSNEDAVREHLLHYPTIGAHHWSAVSRSLASCRSLVGCMLLAESESRAPPLRRRVFLAVRGTVDLQDWWENVKVKPVVGVDGFYHTGFTNRAAWAPLPYLLHQLKLSERKNAEVEYVVVTGHSLGGAVAQKITLSLLQHPYVQSRPQLQQNIRCITFGAPLLANATVAQTVAELYPHQFISIVRTHDIVPRLLSNLHEMLLSMGNALVSFAKNEAALDRLRALSPKIDNGLTVLQDVYSVAFGTQTAVQPDALGTGLMGNLSSENVWWRAVVRVVESVLTYVPFGRFYELGTDSNGVPELRAIQPAELESFMAFPASDSITSANYIHHQLGQYTARVGASSLGNRPDASLSPVAGLRASVSNMTVKYLPGTRVSFRITGENLAAFNNVKVYMQGLSTDQMTMTEVNQARFTHDSVYFERQLEIGAVMHQEEVIVDLGCELQGVFNHQQVRIPSTRVTQDPANDSFDGDLDSLFRRAFVLSILPSANLDDQGDASSLRRLRSLISGLVDDLPLETVFIALAQDTSSAEHKTVMKDLVDFVSAKMLVKKPPAVNMMSVTMLASMGDAIEAIETRLAEFTRRSEAQTRAANAAGPAQSPATESTERAAARQEMVAIQASLTSVSAMTNFVSEGTAAWELAMTAGVLAGGLILGTGAGSAALYAAAAAAGTTVIASGLAAISGGLVLTVGLSRVAREVVGALVNTMSPVSTAQLREYVAGLKVAHLELRTNWTSRVLEGLPNFCGQTISFVSHERHCAVSFISMQEMLQTSKSNLQYEVSREVKESEVAQRYGESVKVFVSAWSESCAMWMLLFVFLSTNTEIARKSGWFGTAAQTAWEAVKFPFLTIGGALAGVGGAVSKGSFTKGKADANDVWAKQADGWRRRGLSSQAVGGCYQNTVQVLDDVIEQYQKQVQPGSASSSPPTTTNLVSREARIRAFCQQLNISHSMSVDTIADKLAVEQQAKPGFEKCISKQSLNTVKFYLKLVLDIHELRYTLERTKIIGLLGNSGSGKSTLLNSTFNQHVTAGGRLVDRTVFPALCSPGDPRLQQWMLMDLPGEGNQRPTGSLEEDIRKLMTAQIGCRVIVIDIVHEATQSPALIAATHPPLPDGTITAEATAGVPTLTCFNQTDVLMCRRYDDLMVRTSQLVSGIHLLCSVVEHSHQLEDADPKNTLAYHLTQPDRAWFRAMDERLVQRLAERLVPQSDGGFAPTNADVGDELSNFLQTEEASVCGSSSLLPVTPNVSRDQRWLTCFLGGRSSRIDVWQRFPSCRSFLRVAVHNGEDVKAWLIQTLDQ